MKYLLIAIAIYGDGRPVVMGTYHGQIRCENAAETLHNADKSNRYEYICVRKG